MEGSLFESVDREKSFIFIELNLGPTDLFEMGNNIVKTILQILIIEYFSKQKNNLKRK